MISPGKSEISPGKSGISPGKSSKGQDDESRMIILAKARKVRDDKSRKVWDK